MHKSMHQPVLVREVFNFLSLHPGDTYLDLTAGYGGHAQEAAEKIGKNGQLILVDRDAEAIKHLQASFKTAQIIHSDFALAAKRLAEDGVKANAILLDIGVSSAQLDQPERGFSFREAGPLDMRMDQRQKLTASDIVNHYSKEDIANILYSFGEERRSRQIAEAIVKARPIRSTIDLADVIARVNFRKGKIHPSTKSFQALRIAVNGELEQLENTLELIPSLLANKGTVVVISFHSLEDRMVKQFIKNSAVNSTLQNLTKKVVTAQRDELSNRRARSAKLRAARKI